MKHTEYQYYINQRLKDLLDSADTVGGLFFLIGSPYDLHILDKRITTFLNAADQDPNLGGEYAPLQFNGSWSKIIRYLTKAPEHRILIVTPTELCNQKEKIGDQLLKLRITKQITVIFKCYDECDLPFFIEKLGKKIIASEYTYNKNELYMLSDNEMEAKLYILYQKSLDKKQKSDKETSNAYAFFSEKEFNDRHPEVFENHNDEDDDESDGGLLMKLIKIKSDSSDSRLKFIYEKLHYPIMIQTVWTAPKTIDSFLASYPNINPNDAQKFKTDIEFCHNWNKGILKFKPILLVGEPGTGKTRFGYEFTQMIGQHKLLVIPCGSSNGVSYLVGSTPDYKNCSEGLILRSIWESNPDKATYNPAILLDEIDKCKFNITDANKDMEGVLCQILADINLSEFKDSFFDVTVRFNPVFIATANSLDEIPEPILDRFSVINFKPFTDEQMLQTVIPQAYCDFLQKMISTDNLPDTLSDDDKDVIYNLCNGHTREIENALKRWIVYTYSNNGTRKEFSYEELMKIHSETPQRHIGFKLP